MRIVEFFIMKGKIKNVPLVYKNEIEKNTKAIRKWPRNLAKHSKQLIITSMHFPNLLIVKSALHLKLVGTIP